MEILFDHPLILPLFIGPNNVCAGDSWMQIGVYIYVCVCGNEKEREKFSFSS